MFKIVPFRSLPAAARRLAAPTDSPWVWAAVLDVPAMTPFWGPNGPKKPAAQGSFARNLGENVFFDFHRTADGWLVFMTNDVEV